MLWELLSDADAPDVPSELELADLAAIDAMIHAADRASATPDEKLERLRAALSDPRPTLVFTSRRATVRYLRDHLGKRRLDERFGAVQVADGSNE